jgi:acetyl-CoA carboxylase beta subunit
METPETNYYKCPACKAVIFTDQMCVFKAITQRGTIREFKSQARICSLCGCMSFTVDQFAEYKTAMTKAEMEK